MNRFANPPRATMGRARPLMALAVVLAVASACASVAPGEDPIVVHAQQALAAGDALYRDGMGYYFTPGVAPTLSPAATKVFEAVRTGFDPLYKDVQGALDSYQSVKAAIAAGKSGDLQAAESAIATAVGKLGGLVNQVISQMPAAALTKSKGTPVKGGS